MNIDKEKDVEKAIDGFTNLMSAFGWNITQEKKTDNNKLDKDIEIVKRLANTKFDKQLLNSIIIIKEQDEVYLLTIQERQAIENVLSELERLNYKLKEKICFEGHSQFKELEKELETYKKIAEKLADKLVEIEDGCKHISTEICNEYSNGRCIQCIIDWAKREVENEKNNSNT